MAQFNDTLMLLAMEPTRYLSIRDCAILERVSQSASDIVWLCYPVVTDLSAFGITDQMTHNAFNDFPRHYTAFFRRFDCSKLTSLRVPWNPQTIVIKNGISCSDAGMLLEKCPNLVELPPVDAKFEDSIGLDNMLSSARKRFLQSVTLYSDLSCYDENKLWNSCQSETRVSSTSVCRLEIAVKIPFNIDFAIDAALGAFITFVSLHFDISAVKSLKIFITSNFQSEDQRDDDSPDERQTYMNLPVMFHGWTSLEELSITIEHATRSIFIIGASKTNLDVFPSLRTFSIVPIHSASDAIPCLGSEFQIFDQATLACMPAIRHINIGSSSVFWLRDPYADKLSVKSRKETLERTVLILNKSKIQNVGIVGPISKEVSTPEILDHIGESGCLRHFAMTNMPVSTDTLLNILKRNKDLKLVVVLDCDDIGDKLFTLLAQAQLRNVSGIQISPCSSAGIRRFIKWRMRQIENGRDLAPVVLTTMFGENDIATLFPNINPVEVIKKGRFRLHQKK